MSPLSTQQNNHSSQLEVVFSMREFVRGALGQYLKPVSESWQPNDLLPDMSDANWVEKINQFRMESRQVADDLFVVLVGDMVTEEALPSYQSWLNGLSGIKDRTGASEDPWAQWSRGWTAEENRHGDLLNRYLYLSGRVDMKAVEVTVQYMIRNGFAPMTDNDPFQGFIYTSFQERATKISHRNSAILASRAGDRKLQDICGLIAGDEARHEKAYQSFVQEIFRRDPVGAVTAFAKMMKKKISMPGLLMFDGEERDLFTRFSIIAQRIGIYTALDYASIIAHLVKEWGVERLNGLSDTAAEAQDYVCGLSRRYERLADRIKIPADKMKFSWIYNRET